MKVWSKNDLKDSFQHVANWNFDRYRVLANDDGALYSAHDAVIHSGAILTICYKNQEEFFIWFLAPGIFMTSLAGSSTSFIQECAIT